MRISKSLLFLMAILLGSTAVAGPRLTKHKPAATVAVWDLSTLGLDADHARRVRYELGLAIKRLEGFRLLGEKRSRARLKRKHLPQDATAGQTARALGARWMLTGTLGGLGDQATLDIRLLDGQTGKQVRQAAINLPLATSELRSALDEILVRLLVPKHWIGSLALDVSEKGAGVSLDGQQVATTPLAGPISGLQPGKHILRITKQGFGEFSKFVVIRYNQLARLKVDLKNAMVVGLLYERKRPKPPVEKPAKKIVPTKVEQHRGSERLRKIMAWSFLGLGAGLGGAGLALGLTRDRPVMTSIFSASGGVLLAGSLILFLVHSGSENPTETSDEPGLALLPGSGPAGSLGVVLSGRF